MTKNTCYVTAEPDHIRAWLDQRGKLHATRDEAIDANFCYDVSHAFADVFENHDKGGLFGQMPVIPTKQFVQTFCEQHPDIVRIWIGDRDKT